MPDENAVLVQRLLDLALAHVETHALILLDPNGVIVGWLAGAERLFGYKPSEIVGKNVATIFTPEDRRNGINNWEEKTAAGAGESEDDRWQLRKDGGRIWVSGTLTGLHDERKRLVGFAKILRNRTDQKFQVGTLQSRIAELSEARHRKNNFIATLAHELRNPLNAISGAIELLAHESAGPSEIELSTGIVRRQVESMGRMINDLLEVSRAATGKIELHRERIVLQDVVHHAIETCRPLIDKQTHEWHELMPDVPIHLDADRARLGQVFVNLLENAVKYTQYGGTIWIKATTEGDEAVVRVADTGVGISPDIMPHIFDLFTQAEATGGPKRGLGIGLSVVKDIVALHGGSVQATSDGLGKGSEFTVRLPLPKA